MYIKYGGYIPANSNSGALNISYCLLKNSNGLAFVLQKAPNLFNQDCLIEQ